MAEDLGNLGLIHQQKGENEKALEYYNESLKLHKEIKNKKGEADQLGNIGGAYQLQGNLAAAQKYEEESLQIHRALGNMDGEANQLGNIGLSTSRKANTTKRSPTSETLCVCTSRPVTRWERRRAWSTSA